MNGSRGRLVFAAATTAVLVAAVVAVAVSGSSDDEAPDDECLLEWNDDALARSDGVHAYTAHGYSATLITRVDPEGNVVEDATGEPTADARCAVVFASPQVDYEPEFGVRVLDAGRWTGLALADRVPLDQIAAMQRDATATANATLLPDGRLAD
jgi:hypothetical protein